MKHLTLFLFLLVFFGCELMFPPKIQIVSATPTGTLVAAPQPFVVRVHFNVSVSRQSAEKAFNLRRNGDLMAGTFAWSGDTAFDFLPVEPFQKGPLYIYRLETSLEDQNGRNLQEEFEAQFSSSTNLMRPTVLSLTGPNGALTDGELWSGVLHPVSISFDTAIPASSIESHVSFSPAVTGYWTPNATRTTYTFQPSSALVWQTRYTLKVSKDLANDAGKTLGNEVSRWFFTGTESVIPSVVSVVQNTVNFSTSPTLNGGVETRDAFSVTFSEPILTHALSSKIKIEPTRALEVVLPDPTATQTTSLTLRWPQGLAWNTVYSLKFLNTIIDPQGNSLAETIFLFRSNGTSSRPPRVLALHHGNALSFTPGTVLTYHADPLWSAGTHHLLFQMELNSSVLALTDWRLLLRAGLLQSWTIRPLSSGSATITLNDLLVDPAPPPTNGKIWVRISLSFTPGPANSITEYTLPKSFVDPSGLSPLETWSWRLSH